MADPTPTPPDSKTKASTSPSRFGWLGIGARNFLGMFVDLRGVATDNLDYYRTRVAAWAMMFLVGGLILVGCCHDSWTGLLWALACFTVGGALGFLFGIPKTAGRRPPKNNAEPGKPDEQAKANESDVNTNLEEISDWITKIIVGMSLIQYREISAYVQGCAHTLAKGLSTAIIEPSQPPAKLLAFAYGLIVYFTIVGFITGYLLTRLFLALGLRLANQNNTQLQELKQQVEQAAKTTQSELGDIKLEMASLTKRLTPHE